MIGIPILFDMRERARFHFELARLANVLGVRLDSTKTDSENLRYIRERAEQLVAALEEK